MFTTLPNQLTLARIAIIPPILLLLAVDSGWSSWIALILFAAAGVTDWLDGYLARRDGHVTAFGKLLDPIADKLLVASVILLLVFAGHINGWTIIPAIIILMREVAVSGLREFLAQVQVSVPVSKLAKWKTALQMVVLGFLIVGSHAPDAWGVPIIGAIGLWIAALLTLYTGWDYWRAGERHFSA